MRRARELLAMYLAWARVRVRVRVRVGLRLRLRPRPRLRLQESCRGGTVRPVREATYYLLLTTYYLLLTTYYLLLTTYYLPLTTHSTAYLLRTMRPVREAAATLSYAAACATRG
jgi:hypothetical protein